jgi:Fe-S-cluster containining protein
MNEEAQIIEAVGEILREVDADVAGRRPVCRASGRCCKFETYGHRLYVTGVELAYFAAKESGGSQRKGEEKASVSLPQFFGGEKFEGCPYQVEGLCTAREGRPLGCRIYFCDEHAQGWQNEVYETYHAKLRAVHERFGVAYRYVEWRAGLRELMEEGKA